MAEKKADFLQGTVEMLVLRLLRSGPLNGWDMMQRVALVSGDVLAVTPGSLYPAQWGTSENDRRAKVYTLTATGRRQLEREAAQWARFSGAADVILRDA